MRLNQVPHSLSELLTRAGEVSHDLKPALQGLKGVVLDVYLHSLETTLKLFQKAATVVFCLHQYNRMIFEDRNRTDGDGLAPAEQKLREDLTRTGFCWCGFLFAPIFHLAEKGLCPNANDVEVAILFNTKMS